MKGPDAFRVAIACNIKTDRSSDAEAEFDEPGTVEAISAALRGGGFETVMIEATERFPQKLEEESPDIVFNIAEGRTGRSREALIPAILEYYGIPFTGSDATALCVAMDKAIAKRIVSGCGLATPAFMVIEHGAREPPSGLPFPVLVKPNAEGSSKGVHDDCVAEDAKHLRSIIDRMMIDCKGDLLAEQYIDGREFTVGILGNGKGIRVFEPMEIIYRKLSGQYKVYSYEVKQNYKEYVSYKCPPDLPGEMIEKIKRDAETIYKALGCLDLARIDFRLSDYGQLFFIELNPLPGLAPGYSDYPMLASFNGIEYDNLIRMIIDCAMKRYGMKKMGTDEQNE